jgi:hypothetical protein
VTDGNDPAAMKCTWLEPSRNGLARCASQPVTAWWNDAWGQRVARCAKHYSPVAGDAALGLGWDVHTTKEKG